MIIIAKWFIVALAFLLASYILPGIEVASFYTALILAFLWGVVNLLVKPILVVLTLPINLITLGLFTFVINGFLLWFLSTIVKGFEVGGFIVAILGAIIISLASSIGNYLIGDAERGK